MKFHERTLVDQQENDASYPSEDIAKHTRHVFLKALGGSRYGNCHRGGGRGLIGAALGAKRCRADFLTTRLTKCHVSVPPGNRLRGSVAEELEGRNGISNARGSAEPCLSLSYSRSKAEPVPQVRYSLRARRGSRLFQIAQVRREYRQS